MGGAIFAEGGKQRALGAPPCSATSPLAGSPQACRSAVVRDLLSVFLGESLGLGPQVVLLPGLRSETGALDVVHSWSFLPVCLTCHLVSAVAELGSSPPFGTRGHRSTSAAAGGELGSQLRLTSL